MTLTVDHAGARSIRAAWLARATYMDPLMANALTRQHLVDSSWNEGAFAAQMVGVRRALEQGLEQGLAADRHCWTLSRDAYDLCPDALYQYLVQCTLNGLWFDAPAAQRTEAAFGPICARTTVGWSLTPDRGQARAVQSSHSAVGWVCVPFAWDDLMQLAVEGFLACLEGPGERVSTQLRDTSRRIESADWGGALPFWQGLVAKAAVGAASLSPLHEGTAIEYLLQSHGALHGGLRHQRDEAHAGLGNVLSHLAVGYTVAHETAHVLAARWHPDPRSALRQDELRWEELADQLALRSLWNYNGITAPHTNADDSEELLWLASGVFFYLGLIVYENGRRVASTASGEGFTRPMEHIKLRFKAFVSACTYVVERLPPPEQHEAVRALATVRRLLPAVVAYANAYLDYCQNTLPEALGALIPAVDLHGWREAPR